ncbi:MAG: TonB family protein [Rhizonema sp. PD38]|nr:TonB family protein [Rhizonema sp. PD38]
MRLNNNASDTRATSDRYHKYPQRAKRRGIEGRMKVSVDTNYQWHVINARLPRSSGSRDLNEDTLRQARDWK